MEWGAKALQAARRLNLLTDATINQILVKVAEEAIANTSYILAENKKIWMQWIKIIQCTTVYY